MRPPQHSEPSIAEQAARWVGTLEQNGESEREAFAAWLQASPQHVREFLLATAVDKETGTLDLRDFDVDEILKKGDDNVVWWEEERQEKTRHKRSSWGWSIAAAAALVAIAIGWWVTSGPGSWQGYSTVVGEQRAFELKDGSVLELNPFSSVKVRLTDDARDIRLLSGEAFFKVESDPSRPFQVHSGDTVIRAVGTQFLVHRRTGSVTVSVTQGRVQVKERMLNAGQEMKILASGQTIERTAADPAQMDGWRRRQLTFSGDTLAEIAEDFNRYNRAPQIRIEGEALRARQFSGVFDADDPRSLVDYLARVAELSIDRSARAIIIRDGD